MKEIINHLTIFSKETRYYNLDVLAGKNDRPEPLISWYNNIISAVMDSNISKVKRAKIERMIEKQENLMNSISHLGWFVDIESELTSFRSFAHSTEIIKITAPFVILEFSKIVVPIIEFLDQLSSLLHTKKNINLPYIKEYFSYNVLMDKASLLKYKVYKVNYSDY